MSPATDIKRTVKITWKPAAAASLLVFLLVDLVTTIMLVMMSTFIAVFTHVGDDPAPQNTGLPPVILYLPFTIAVTSIQARTMGSNSLYTDTSRHLARIDSSPTDGCYIKNRQQSYKWMQQLARIDSSPTDRCSI